MKDREIRCIHYQYEHSCALGKDAEFRGLCQTCPNWKPLRGSRPARKDNRKQKLNKIQKRELRNY